MKKDIYIINYHGDGASIYGIGTFIKEYIHCLKNIDCRINLIEIGIVKGNKFNFSIKEEDGIRKMQIPYSFQNNLAKYSRGICRLLRLYINDSSNLIFHFHYLYKDYYLFDKIKTYFPHSKLILNIHFLYGSSKLSGNISLYKSIIKNQQNKSIKEKYQDVIDNYIKEKKFIEKVDAVVCLSEDTFSLVQAEYKVSKNKLHLILNGLRNNSTALSQNQKLKLRQQYFINPDEKILLFVGRVDLNKGIYSLIACFDKVLKEYPECRLVIIGDGDISGAIKKCKNVWSRIIFTGRLDQKSLYKWYQISDIALFLSFHEECSYVGIEMMMHGLPVIASDGLGVKNMFHEGVNAKIAKIANLQKLSGFENNLSEVILDALHDDMSELKNEAIKIYESTYKINIMQKKYKQLIDSL